MPDAPLAPDDPVARPPDGGAGARPGPPAPDANRVVVRPETPYRRERRLAAEDLSVRRRFFGALASSTRSEVVATLLLAANLAVFAAMVVTGVGLLAPSPEDLVAWGALRPLLVRDGEPWRLLTACFLHIGLLHVAVNMFSLWSMRFVEAWFGHLGFAVLYFASGLFGSLASTWWSDPFVVGAGASGALFGILGAVLGATVRWKRLGVPSAVTGPMFKGVVNTLVLNGLIMVSIPNLDQAAHAGGFVSGALLGYVLAHAPTVEGVTGRRRRGWLTAAASAVVIGAILVALRRPGLAAAGETVEWVRADEEVMASAWPSPKDPLAPKGLEAVKAAHVERARTDWLPYIAGREADLRRVRERFPELRRGIDEWLERYRQMRATIETPSAGWATPLPPAPKQR